MTDPNISLVLDELESAKEKHPHFIDVLTRDNATQIHQRLSYAKMGQTTFRKRISFDDILYEEMAEAALAYIQGDLAHARQELAQCAAVCIRGMEYIEHELDNRKQEDDK